MEKKSKFDKYIIKCYHERLERIPDKEGLAYFQSKLEDGKLQLEYIPQLMENSNEYKSKHAINLDRNGLQINEWMKRDWNNRAKIDFKVYVGLESDNEDDFWKNGQLRIQKLLDVFLYNKQLKNMSILEIGCGVGRLLIPLSSIFKEVVGVDISNNMLEICKKNIRNIKNCKVYQNSGSELKKFNDASFDFCLAHTIFHHIPEKNVVIKYIQEVYRILRDKGIFIFNVLTPKDKEYKHNKSPNTQFGVTFSENEIVEIARNTNFEIIKTYYDERSSYNVIFRRK